MDDDDGDSARVGGGDPARVFVAGEVEPFGNGVPGCWETGVFGLDDGDVVDQDRRRCGQEHDISSNTPLPRSRRRRAVIRSTRTGV